MESDDGFRSFSHAIESDPLGVLLAKWRRDAFTRKLKQLDDVVEVIPSGSLARGTQIGPIHDVDLIVVFDQAKHPDFGHGGPESVQKVLTYLQGKLVEQLHPLTADLRAEGATEGLVEDAVVEDTLVKDTEQRMHVVTCRGGWIGEFTNIIPSTPPVDVMPAVREGSHLLVPERGKGWIDVDPEKLMRQVAQRQREWKYFTEVVGMMKAWAENEGLDIKNLAIEVMVLKYCPRPGFFETLSCGEAVAQLFEAADKAHITSLEDPAGRCGKIDPKLKYSELQAKLTRAAELARQAMDIEHVLENEPSMAEFIDPDIPWRELFGRKYPRARGRFLRVPAFEPWFGKYRPEPAARYDWDNLWPHGPDNPGPKGPDDHGPKGPDDLGPKGPEDLGPKGPDDLSPKGPDNLSPKGLIWPVHDLGEPNPGPREGGDGTVSQPSKIFGPRVDSPSVGSARSHSRSNLWSGVFGSAATTVSVPLTFG